MSRFWGNHPGTQQARGSRRVSPSTPQERLAAMERGLANMKEIFGDRHWLVLKQIGRIAELKRGAER